MAFGDLKCFARMPRFEHSVAVHTKNMAGKVPDGILVFDQEDRFPPFRLRSAYRTSGGGFFRSIDHWQIDLETGSASHSTLGEDMAAALFDDPVDCGQSQPTALSLAFGGKEGLKDARERYEVHTAARIRYLNGHPRAGNAIGGAHHAAFGFGNIPGFDCQPAAFGHGIPCIDGKIDDNLFDLAGIGLNAPKALGCICDEFDVLADQTAKHLVHVGYDEVQIEDLRL